MKFSDIEQNQWESLKPYLDTALLPITGISGMEQPWEATVALERLRDVMDLVEGPYKGRLVTYPAMHYSQQSESGEWIDKVCMKLKQGGFKFVVVISSDITVSELEIPHADAILTASLEEMNASSQQVKMRMKEQIEKLWN